MSGRMKNCIRICFVLLAVLCATRMPVWVFAKEAGDYTQDYFDMLDVGELDNFVQGQEELDDITFSDLVGQLIQGKWELDGKKLMEQLLELLWSEIETNKSLLIMVLLLAVSCTFVKNIAEAFRNSYVSDICFALIYMQMMVMLLKSFQIAGGIVTDALNRIIEFMTVLVPVFCMSLSLGLANLTSAGFYQLAFMVIYAVQWIMLELLVPLVQVLVVLQFMNYMVKGEKFTRMCELLEDGIRWCLKCVISVIVGLNVIQVMVAPAVDRLKTSSVTRGVGMIPGVGNISNALSDMLLGAGMVIKSSVGTAGIIVLLLIAMLPFLKLLILALLYKVTAAVTEPVADKRIAGSINGVYVGCVLMVKILLTSLVLFVVTIAIVATTSNAVTG
ncbi:MAG: stage III sporulation protein AE [Lachnospiraceae bacterium]|nr:stage III sporulation protein AE [Lachnospiraceae bacterium]